MAKESVVKATGRFIANELLGVDDAKRAISKAKKGDVKGAVKSAATAALEAGSTVVGAGIGAKLGAKAGLKAGEKVAESGAKRTAERAMQKTAESIPAPKYGKPGGEVKTVRTNPKDDITIRRDLKQPSQPGDVKMHDENAKKVAVSKPKSATYTTPERTSAQRQGEQEAQKKARERKIIESGATSYEASREVSRAPGAGKLLGKAAGGAAGVAAVASTKKVDEPSTQSGNVRHRNYTKTVK